jgi:hypothetical protein
MKYRAPSSFVLLSTGEAEAQCNGPTDCLVIHSRRMVMGGKFELEKVMDSLATISEIIFKRLHCMECNQCQP